MDMLRPELHPDTNESGLKSLDFRDYPTELVKTYGREKARVMQEVFWAGARKFVADPVIRGIMTVNSQTSDPRHPK